MNKKFLLICACTLAATAMLGCNEAQNWPDKDNATCGNGIREVGEICDTIASVTCSYYDPTQAWASGTPGCSDTCQLTQGTCSLSSAVGGAYCGNNTIDGAEPCDGYMFADTTMTCASVLGAGATGALTCQNCQISTANCTLPSTCGNGIIDAGEVCDGTQFNGATCTAPGGAQMEGNLRCVDCISIDRSGCTPVEGSYCGDGNIDTADGELCDGSNLGGKTCADIAAGTTGELKCNPSTCQYDTTACVAEPFCGDKVKNNSEECDANDFGTLTCADYKGEGATGNLSCNSDCTVISDACLAADDEPVCGDGFANGTEECDQTDLAGATCASVTGKADAIGTLSCSTSCTLDASACTYCGDSIVNGSEACDGSALNNATCESAMGAGATGTVSCNADCTLNISACEAPVTCGNGVLEAGEACDGGFIAEGATPACPTGQVAADTLVCVTGGCTLDLTASCVPAEVCGDNYLHEDEFCDIVDGNVVINSEIAANGLCSELDSKYIGGKLGCDSTCMVTETACEMAPADVCGDNKVGAEEICDIVDGNTVINPIFVEDYPNGLCSEYDSKYVSGSLVCNATCDDFDVTQCVEAPADVCGDNKVGADEICDIVDGNTVINTIFAEDVPNGLCSEYDSKYISGSLVCNATCDDFDVTQCVEAPAEVCGDNYLHEDEFCDIVDGNVVINPLFAANGLCSEYDSKYVSGNLGCDSSCMITETACSESSVGGTCGNSLLDAGETCDPSLPVYTPMACLYDNTVAEFSSLLNDKTKYLVGSNTCSATCEFSSSCSTMTADDFTVSNFYSVFTANQANKLIKNPSTYGVALALSSKPTYDSTNGIASLQFGPWHDGQNGQPNLNEYVEFDLTFADKQSTHNFADMDHVSIFFNYRHVNSLSAKDFGIMLYDGNTPVRLITKFHSSNAGNWKYSGNIVFSIEGVTTPKLRFVSYTKGGNIYLKELKISGLKAK